MTSPALRHAQQRTVVRSRRVWGVIKRKLHWGRLYGAASYLRSTLWTVPLFAIALVFVVAPPLRILDAWLGWQLNALAPAGAQGLYQTVITLALSFLVFTFGSLLVAIQVASGQLTPRIIATLLLRDNVVRYSVGLFVFTLVFAVMALNRVEAAVPQLVALLTAVLGVACIADFLFLIDYAARLLRPVSVVATVGDEGVEVIRSVYPARTAELVPEAGPLRAQIGAPARTVLHNSKAGIVLAVDLATLVTLGGRHDGVIELVAHVGDFVAVDEPLFALYGGASTIEDEDLRASVAMGPERTLEQDPMFAFRILVDIALKALSPAINDPTTAVLAIDQVHRLLRFLGKHHLRGEVVCDPKGVPRVIFRTPNWEDFVCLACTEIRACGASNMQIARRMRALLEDVGRVLPEFRQPSIQTELVLLDRAVESLYTNPEDRALARIPDVQGLGGSPATYRV